MKGTNLPDGNLIYTGVMEMGIIEAIEDGEDAMRNIMALMGLDAIEGFVHQNKRVKIISGRDF